MQCTIAFVILNVTGCLPKVGNLMTIIWYHNIQPKLGWKVVHGLMDTAKNKMEKLFTVIKMIPIFIITVQRDFPP